MQNDHKSLMKQIEAGLQHYYGSQGENTSSNGSQNGEHNSTRPTREVYKTPFARIDLVSPGSPAEYSVRYNILYGSEK